MNKKTASLRQKILACAAVFAACAVLGSCITPEKITVTSPDFSKLKDGVYSGEYDGSMGKAAVTAAVENGRVTDLRLTKFESSPVGTPAKTILSRVTAAQSLTVDAVSGATYSSRVILRAAQNALDKAVD